MAPVYWQSMGLAVAPSRKNGLSVFQGSSIESHAKNTWLNLPARSVRANFGSIGKLVAHRFWHQRQKLRIASAPPARAGERSTTQPRADPACSLARAHQSLSPSAVASHMHTHTPGVSRTHWHSPPGYGFASSSQAASLSTGEVAD
jgi:hypothetical protein